MDRLEANLSKDASLISKVQLFEIQEDKDNIPTSLDSLIKETASLSLLVDDISDLESNVDKIIGNANKLIRDVNVLLKLSRSETSVSQDDSILKPSIPELSYHGPPFVPGKKTMSSVVEPQPTCPNLSNAQNSPQGANSDVVLLPSVNNIQGVQSLLPSSLPPVIQTKKAKSSFLFWGKIRLA